MKKQTMAIIGLAMCSNIAWAECKTDAPPSTPTAEFTDHKNGTVTHKKTGLMWKTCSEGYEYKNNTCAKASGTKDFTWDAAMAHAEKINKTGFAGHKDWRVPAVKELTSIIEKTCTKPAINATIFPNTSQARYWTASPYAYGQGLAWIVDFRTGNDNNSYKKGSYRVRLVRGK